VRFCQMSSGCCEKQLVGYGPVLHGSLQNSGEDFCHLGAVHGGHPAIELVGGPVLSTHHRGVARVRIPAAERPPTLLARHPGGRMLCPIARGLDHVGDRWTLLILRDLHAGPARFSDISSGLVGLATNLLTERLRGLEEDGLIRRREADFGITVYELTDKGEATGGLLFELAQLGSQFPPDEDPPPLGNRRSMAVTLKEVLRRTVAADGELRAGLIVDDEPYMITIDGGNVSFRQQTLVNAEAVIATSYEPLIAAADGDLSLDAFASNHVTVVSGEPDKVEQLFVLFAQALEAF
jgi:DNA-binding HxlR family transcriptional regulator